MFRKNLFRRIVAFAGKNLLGTITEVSTKKNVAAFTFDDGPSQEYTPKLLDILHRYQAKATFFMLGKQIQQYPQIVKQVIDSGHAIGNHAWDHPSFPMISAQKRRQQIIRCQQVLEDYDTNLFRPPFGHQNFASRLDTLLLGYKVITWNIAAEDWLEHNAQEKAERIIRQIRPGSIILLHDFLFDNPLSRNPDSSADAVDIILDKLSNSYQFVTVPELLKLGRPRKKNWYVKADKAFLAQLKKEPAINV